jgi:hypothetical protein
MWLSVDGMTISLSYLDWSHLVKAQLNKKSIFSLCSSSARLLNV